MEEPWVPYHYDKWYRVRVEVKNSDPQANPNARGVHIKVYLDATLIFNLVDPVTSEVVSTDESPAPSPVFSGKVGLYCWGNQAACFKNLTVRDAALLHFVTSRFRSFREMIDSANGRGSNQGTPDNPLVVDSVAFPSDVRTPNGTYAAARYKAQYVEDAYQRKSARRVETAKTDLDQAGLDLYEAFTALVEGFGPQVQDLLFGPSPETLEVHRLIQDGGGNGAKTVGFFIRSPEPIDWQEVIGFKESPDEPQFVSKRVGRVSLSVSNLADGEDEEGENVDGSLLYRPDGMQALFHLNDPVAATHAFKFRFKLEGKVDCPRSVLQVPGAAGEDRAELVLRLVDS